LNYAVDGKSLAARPEEGCWERLRSLQEADKNHKINTGKTEKVRGLCIEKLGKQKDGSEWKGRV